MISLRGFLRPLVRGGRGSDASPAPGHLPDSSSGSQSCDTSRACEPASFLCLSQEPKTPNKTEATKPVALHGSNMHDALRPKPATVLSP